MCMSIAVEFFKCGGFGNSGEIHPRVGVVSRRPLRQHLHADFLILSILSRILCARVENLLRSRRWARTLKLDCQIQYVLIHPLLSLLSLLSSLLHTLLSLVICSPNKSLFSHDMNHTTVTLPPITQTSVSLLSPGRFLAFIRCAVMYSCNISVYFWRHSVEFMPLSTRNCIDFTTTCIL